MKLRNAEGMAALMETIVTERSAPSKAPSKVDAKVNEKRLLDALEKARQTVKPLVKRALQAEDVPNDLLSFRLKSAGR
jgi:hypothetical protein